MTQVSQLKNDIADAVASIVEFNKSRSQHRAQADSFSSAQLCSFDDYNQVSQISTDEPAPIQSGEGDGDIEMKSLHPHYDNVVRPTSSKFTGRQKQAEEQEDVMLNDLQDILELTAVFTPPSHDTETVPLQRVSDYNRRSSQHNRRSSLHNRRSSEQSRRRGSDFALHDFYDWGQCEEEPAPTAAPEESDDWEDIAVDDLDAHEQEPRDSQEPQGMSAFTVQGYLLKQKPNSTKFQRRYFVLSQSHLLYYTSKSDMGKHISRTRGIISIQDFLSVDRKTSKPLDMDLVTRDRTYTLQAYTSEEYDMWYNALLARLVRARQGTEEETSKHWGDSSFVLSEEGYASLSAALALEEEVNRKSQQHRRSSVSISRAAGGAADATSAIPTVANIDLCEMRGMLKKKNMLYWQDRWFEITQPGYVHWYTSQADALRGRHCAKGSFSVMEILSLQQSESDPSCFDIDVKGRTYELQADSGGVADEWCQKLGSWIQHTIEQRVPADSKLTRTSSLNSTNHMSTSGPSQENSDDEIRHSHSILTRQQRRSSIQAAESLQRTSHHVEDSSATLPCKSGWLEKRGGRGNWQRRWFVLDENGDLAWYAHESDYVSKGLAAAKGSLKRREILSLQQSVFDDCYFDIDVKGRTYELKAFSPEDSSDWYNLLLSWMHYEASSMIAPPPLVDPTQNRSESGADNLFPRERRGMLKKRGEGHGIWRVRWFELTTPGILVWYSNEGAMLIGPHKAKGFICLLDVLAVELSTEDPLCLEVMVKGRTYHLQALSEKDALDWCDALTSWTQVIAQELDLNPEEAKIKYTWSFADFVDMSGRCEQDSSFCRDTSSITQNWLIKSGVVVGESGDGARNLPARKGLLKKRGGRNGMWQSRWFDLSYPGDMAWYANEKDMQSGASSRKGAVSMYEVTCVEKVESNPHLFNVVVENGRTYELQASDAELVELWVKDIEAWLAHCTEHKPLIVLPHATASPNQLMPEKLGLVKAKIGTSYWVQHWMELRRPGELALYLKDTDAAEGVSRARVMLEMSNILSVDLSTTDNSCVSVSVKGTVYELQTYSPADCQEWYEVLMQWMLYICNENPLVVQSAKGKRCAFFPRRKVMLGESTLCSRADSAGSVGQGDNEVAKSGDIVSVSQMQEQQSECEPASYAGNLKKRGGTHGMWQSRWCEVRYPGVLAWYGSERDASEGTKKAKGIVALSDAIAVSLSSTNHLCVEVRGRTYEFQAVDEMVAQNWCESLIAWTAFAYQHVSAMPVSIEHRLSSVPFAEEREEACTQSEGIEVLGQCTNGVEEPAKSCRVDEPAKSCRVDEPEKSCRVDEPEKSCRVDEPEKSSRVDEPEKRSRDCVDEPEKSSRVSRKVSWAERPSYISPVNLPTLSGFLKKKGGRQGQVWQQRWFELGHPGVLKWYLNEKSTGGLPKGSVDLTTILKVSNAESDPCGLEFSIKGRVYELQGYTPEDAMSWATAIAAWVEVVSPRQRSSSMQMLQRGRRRSIGQFVEMTGLLKKKGGIFGTTWQDRFVSLQRPGKLYWYVSEKAFQKGVLAASGSMVLLDVLSVDMATGDSTCFEVNVRGRCYEFKADTTEAATRWRDALLDCIAILQHLMRPRHSIDSDGHSQEERVVSMKPSFVSTPETTPLVELYEPDGEITSEQVSLDIETYAVTVAVTGDFAQSEVYTVLNEIIKEVVGRVLSEMEQQIAVAGLSGALLNGCDAVDNRQDSPLRESGDELNTVKEEIMIQEESNLPSTMTSCSCSPTIQEGAITEIDNEDSGDSSIKESLTMEPEVCCVEDLVLPEDKVAHDHAANCEEKSEEQHESDMSSHGTANVDDTSLVQHDRGERRGGLGMLFSRISVDYGTLPTEENDENGVPLVGVKTDINSSADSEGSGDDNDDADSDSDSDDDDFLLPSSASQRPMPDKKRTRRLIRQSSILPRAWNPDLANEEECPGNLGVEDAEACPELALLEKEEEEEEEVQIHMRRSSDAAHRVFMKVNSRNDEDEFVNKLKTRSYQDLNKEFWVKHKWYLVAVVCFVTLHVLHATSYINSRKP